MTPAEFLTDHFDETFHTGLRKGLDTRYSVLSYNIIHLVPNEVWQAFCAYMIAGLKDKPISAECFGRLLAKWRSDVFLVRLYQNDNAHWERLKRDSRLIYAFDAAMNCMPLEDVAALVEWFSYCHRVEAEGETIG